MLTLLSALGSLLSFRVRRRLTLELELVEATATQTTVRLVLPAQRTATLQWSRELVFWINHQTIAATAAQRTIEFKLPAESGRFLRVLVQP